MRTSTLLLIPALLGWLWPALLPAGEVRIEFVEIEHRGDAWSFAATLRHGDTGWDHYADQWRVVDDGGRVLGWRVLYHPHVDEQPFTRSLEGLQIPPGTTLVYVEAHDKIHGWSPRRIEIDLRRSAGPDYRVGGG